MIKILFLIHDLGQGGAEKVLINLVNNMDRSKFDISVTVLFGGGVNEQFLKPHIHYHSIYAKAFPGNSKVMLLLSPEQLHRKFIREHYDIEVSYLEGPAARIISGCTDPNTKLVSWIHCTMQSAQDVSIGFRNFKEAEKCFNKMDSMVFVSQGVQNAFLTYCQYRGACKILYNTNETDEILKLRKEPIESELFDMQYVRLIGVGKLMPVKGFDRLLSIHKCLTDEGYKIHTYLLGEGAERSHFENYIAVNNLCDSVTLLGYQTNPYKYLARADIYICSSLAEGFSTAATEALIVGTPVCTVDVSGMKEMLGEHGEYGLITENNEKALYRGIKQLLDNPELLAHYKKQAEVRGQDFSTEKTVQAVEDMLEAL